MRVGSKGDGRRRNWLFAVVALCAVVVPALAQDDPVLAQQMPRHDGTYQAHEADHPMYGGTITFRKRGEHAVGMFATPYGLMCYQGTLSRETNRGIGEIQVADVIRLEHDATTNAARFVPVYESDRDHFTPLRFGTPVELFPNPYALLATPPALIARDTGWLNECSKHYGEPEEPPAPCGDPSLRGTELNEGSMKYFDSEPVCTWYQTHACTVENVFAVLLATPAAIGPLRKDVGQPQVVEDCGMLLLESIGADNRIRTEIDERHHLIRNYTLPGHIFYPGSVIRFVVDINNRVDINTEGLGTENLLKKSVNEAFALFIWKRPNQALRDAFFAKYAPQAKPKKKPTHKK